MIYFILGWVAAFPIGFLAAGAFYRLGVRDALLGLPHPRELVSQAIEAMKDGRDPMHSSPTFAVKDDEEYGS